MVALPLFLRLDGNVDPRFSKDFFFSFAAILAVVLFGIKKKPDVKTTIFAAYFLIICYVNQYHQASITISYQMSMITAGILVVFQAAQITKYNIILNGISLVCIIQALCFIAQKFGYSPNALIFDVLGVSYKQITKVNGVVTAQPVQLIVGSLGQQTLSGALIAISLPSLFRKGWYYFIPLSVIGIYLSTSSMSLATAVFITGAYVFRNYFKYYLIAMVGLVAALIPLMQKDTFIYNGERFKIWVEALKWLDGINIMFGKGLGYFHDFFSRTHTSNEIFRQAHNEFIDLYIIGGAFALCVFGCYLYSVGRDFRRDTTKTPFYLIFFASLFNSLGSFPYHISATALVGLLSLGIIIKQEKENGIFIK